MADNEELRHPLDWLGLDSAADRAKELPPHALGLTPEGVRFETLYELHKSRERDSIVAEPRNPLGDCGDLLRYRLRGGALSLIQGEPLGVRGHFCITHRGMTLYPSPVPGVYISGLRQIEWFDLPSRQTTCTVRDRLAALRRGRIDVRRITAAAIVVVIVLAWLAAWLLLTYPTH